MTVSYCKFSAAKQAFPKKDTDLWTNSKSLNLRFEEDKYRCTKIAPCIMFQEKNQHMVRVQDLSGRGAEYPSTFCQLVASLIRADVIESKSVSSLGSDLV